MKTVVFLILSFAFFAGGIALMGVAPTLDAWQALVFFAGIVCVALAFALPMNVLPKLD